MSDSELNNQNVDTSPKKTKSTAAESAKTVAILVAICLFCCVLLAVCNDVFYVSEEDQLQRAIAKVYPGTFSSPVAQTLDSAAAENSAYGKVTAVYKSAEGDYIIRSQGIGGYGGTVTLYVAVRSSDATIVGWSIVESDGETLLGNITSSIQKTWYVGSRVDADLLLADNKVSGTTLSSRAINNAVNMAAYYCINGLKLISTPESEARDAVVALLGEGYTLNVVDDADYLAACVAGDSALSFYFEAVKDDVQLAVYVYGEDSNRQIVAVKDNVTHTERLEESAVAAKSGNASAEVVSQAQNRSYFEYKVQKSHAGFTYDGLAELDADFAANEAYGSVDKVFTSADGSIVVQATGIGGFSDGTVTVNVIIADGVIKGWYIVSSQSQSYISNITAAQEASWYVGQSISSEIALGDNKVSGVTRSSTAINNAVNMACYYARNIAD